MKVIIVSNDRDLQELCRSLLRQLCIDGPIMEAPGGPHAAGDLTIWDLSSGPLTTNLEELMVESRDLFVVSRASLAGIHKLLPGSAFGLLVKPVRRPVLEAFLSAALNRRANAEGQAASSLGDREDLLQALFEANIRLQESDHDRTNFLARALHDFRTPLTALQGYCGMLIGQSSGQSLDADQLDLLQRMQHSVGRLSKMSRAMFELSVRHNAERKPNLIRMPIETCVQNAVNQILPVAEDRGINVSWELEPVASLYIDPASIEQVLINLLENSCKFTPRNGSIEIRGRTTTIDRHSQSTEQNGSKRPSLERSIPGYLIELQDTGMGILPEHLESVFEEYTSYSGARDRSGGGLGLAISKMLILEHKGTIWAESDQQGTTISFVLPIHQENVLYASPAATDRGMVRAIQ